MAIQQTTVRIPKKLYEQLKKIANQNERSINAQVIFILRKFIEQEKDRNEQ